MPAVGSTILCFLLSTRLKKRCLDEIFRISFSFFAVLHFPLDIQIHGGVGTLSKESLVARTMERDGAGTNETAPS